MSPLGAAFQAALRKKGRLNFVFCILPYALQGPPRPPSLTGPIRLGPTALLALLGTFPRPAGGERIKVRGSGILLVPSASDLRWRRL